MSPQQVTKAIREDIVQRVFQPGQRLTEDALAERYGVSRVPVREALRTLEAEGFVHSQPYVGTFVAELGATEAEDLLEIRGLLEPLCAGRAAMRRTPEQLGRLKELVELGREAVEAGRLEELARLNSRFHEVIAEASGSATLSQLFRQLSQKIAWVYSAEPPHRTRDSWLEHEEICESLEQGDPERAIAVVTGHINQAQEAYRLRESVSAEVGAAEGGTTEGGTTEGGTAEAGSARVGSARVGSAKVGTAKPGAIMSGTVTSGTKEPRTAE